MSCEVIQWAGYIDGDFTLADSPDAYVGGQPARLSGGRVNLCKSATLAQYIGILKNDSGDDLSQGPQVDDALMTGDKDCSVIIGANKVKLSPSLINGVSTPPFAYPPTGGGSVWADTDLMYIDTNGKWDNAPATGGDPKFGRVVQAPASATDDLIFLQFPMGLVS